MNTVNVKNKKASFKYEVIEKYTAGIQLKGTEIKSIRDHKVSINESFCEFTTNELYLINMNVEKYHSGSYFNHDPKRTRKLLLKKIELKKLHKRVLAKGLAIIPLRLFISEKGLAKIAIALVKGKKIYDKREHIKDRENKRNLNRLLKSKKI